MAVFKRPLKLEPLPFLDVADEKLKADSSFIALVPVSCADESQVNTAATLEQIIV